MNKTELIDRAEVIEALEFIKTIRHMQANVPLIDEFIGILNDAPAIDAAPVRRGEWVLTAHDERVNGRWSVTANCSECNHDKKEVWAGFFVGIPADIAEYAAINSAESVVLDNFCPNCGADMRGVSE